jgi:hypothetical protein
MCGPTSGNSNSNMGMTGLGDKERRVSVQDVEKVVIQYHNGGLHHVQFANAYSTLLCNLAEAYELTGNAPAASDHLSSALTALNTHVDDVRSHPYFARPLRMIATAHMKVSHAVTAEGLYRSGLDKLQQSPDYR